MGTYANALTDINGLFTQSYWTGQNIAIYPDNYYGTISNPNEYLKLSVLPSTSENMEYGSKKRLSGTIIIKILVKSGEGQTRILAIADILDILMQRKVLTNNTELGTSYTTMDGLDSANQSLYSAKYIIPFKIHGE